MYKNSEGYNDPTAGEAIGRITGEEKKARSDRRKAQRKKNRQARGRNTREHKDKPLRHKEEADI